MPGQKEGRDLVDHLAVVEGGAGLWIGRGHDLGRQIVRRGAVERNNRGEVLSAERVQYDGRDMHRVKVVDDQGRVRVFMQEPRHAEGARPAQREGGSRRPPPPPHDNDD